MLTHLADGLLIPLISALIQRHSKPTWPHHLQTTGIGLLILGGLIIIFDLLLARRLLDIFRQTGEKIRALEGRIESALQPHVSFIADKDKPAPKGRLVNWVDVGVAIFFLAVAGFLFLSRIQSQYPHVIIGGDGGNILSFAVALDHPEYFTGDELLNNLNNFSIYATLNIPFIRWMNQYTGDYGLAFSYLLLPQVFIQLLGFYILGRVLFKQRGWAFLFTLILAMPFDMNLEETWGIQLEPVSRFNFQALLPYVLALAYTWRDKPRRWPWVMLLAGLLVFVHPVSTPAWGVALWLGFIPFLPKTWSKGKSAAVLLGLGALFLAAASPFIVNYLIHHTQGKSADYKLVYQVIVTYLPDNLLNIPAALRDFLLLTLKSGLLPASVVGATALWLLLRHDRSRLKLALFWLLGIFLVSVLLPWVEQSVERFYRIIPIETDLVRGMRYFVFFMLILCLWPLAELAQRFLRPATSKAALVCGILFAGVWMGVHHPDLQVLRSAADCLTQGKLVCPVANNDSALIEAIRSDTPQDARFFASFGNRALRGFGITIRTAGLRSLVYTFKDRAMMVYSNNVALESWYTSYRRIEQIHHTLPVDYAVQFKEFVNLASGLGADYLVIDFPLPENVVRQYPLKTVYQDSLYTMFYMKQAP